MSLILENQKDIKKYKSELSDEDSSIKLKIESDLHFKDIILNNVVFKNSKKHNITFTRCGFSLISLENINNFTIINSFLTPDLRFSNCENIKISNSKFYYSSYSPYRHLAISDSKDIIIENCSFKGPFNGYCISTDESCNIKLRNINVNNILSLIYSKYSKVKVNNANLSNIKHGIYSQSSEIDLFNITISNLRGDFISHKDQDSNISINNSPSIILNKI